MPSTTFVDLSRFQFATTAAFHMTFPALSVGLAIFLVICYGAYCKTSNPLYLQMFRFWAQDLRGRLRARDRGRHRAHLRARP